MTDLALAFYLILISPAVQLWRSVRQRHAPTRPRAQGYVSTMRTISLALITLAAACWANGHSAYDLSLGVWLGAWLSHSDPARRQHRLDAAVRCDWQLLHPASAT